jgi:hypothetical protein
MKPAPHPPIRGAGAGLTRGRKLPPAPAPVGSDTRRISAPAGKIAIPTVDLEGVAAGTGEHQEMEDLSSSGGWGEMFGGGARAGRTEE